MSDKTEREYLVGIYYFAGWWPELPNKYHTAGHNWTADYPGRVPSLGLYVEQETMDKEIIAASSYGVDFFQILWYPPLQDARLEANAEHLNDGVSSFMASPNSHMMKFSVEYVNHAPFTIETDEAWDSTCRLWAQWMNHPDYLRVDGRPVFKIHGAHQFRLQNGEDSAKVNARVDILRRIVQESGLPNPLISAGIMPYEKPLDEHVESYDFVTTYMDMPDLPVTVTPHAYSELINHAAGAWEFQGIEAVKPYMPFVPSGWDPRPWKDPRPSFNAPTSAEWVEALNEVKAALDSSERLGIPVAGSAPQKAFIIYAWNEYGEGGIMAPTQGEGYMKLEAVRSVFGSQSAKGST